MTKPTHKPKETKNAKRILDVVPPGKAMAHPTSRPVITGHNAPVADDQFVPKATDANTRSMANDPSEKRDLLDARQKVQISPVADSSVSGSTETKPDSPAAVSSRADAQPTAPEVVASEHDASAVPVAVAVPVQTQTALPVAEAALLKPAATAPASAQAVAAPQPASAEPSLEAQSTAPEEPKPTPEHLAVEQVVAETVETPSQAPVTPITPTTDKPAATAWQLPEEEKHAPVQGHHSAKTIDELLAETGAPNLEPAQAPPKQLIVSHHAGGKSHSAVKWLVAVVLIIILVVVVADVLLDAGTITTDMGIPHTNFIN